MGCGLGPDNDGSVPNVRGYVLNLAIEIVVMVQDSRNLEVEGFILFTSPAERRSTGSSAKRRITFLRYRRFS